jgi:hypothetical protein
MPLHASFYGDICCSEKTKVKMNLFITEKKSVRMPNHGINFTVKLTASGKSLNSTNSLF